MSLLLAKAEFPEAPLDLQIHIGWLTLLLAGLLLVWVWSRSEPLRRVIFAREDPRLFGLFRIGLGLITFQNFWNLRMHWRMLWTDQGMFTGPEVRQRLGRAALTGWTEVDGFLDGWALVKFFWGKYSLLFIESDPAFVQIYLALLFVVLVLFTIGFRTRVTAVLSLLMIVSLYNRNAVFLEGHDTVFKCMWFFTIFARTDEAWSVDNWLRRKRERWLAAKLVRGREGASAAVPFDWMHFADRAGHWLWGGLWAWLFCAAVDYTLMPVIQVVLAGLTLALIVGLTERNHRIGLAEQGKLEIADPIRFRLIPAWPRYLFIFQLVCIYSATGLYKTGAVWQRGDALYYALNMDHFYRFEVVTQWVSLYFGTNVFKVMSLVTWWWEKLFALVLIGLILRFREVHRDQKWFQDFEAPPWRKWLSAATLVGAYALAYRIATLAYPWCLALQKDKAPTPAGPGLESLNILMLAVIPGLILAWHLLGRWPLPVGKLFARVFRGRFADAKIDQPLVRKWVFGRRIWIGVGLIFHGLLLTTMNIGMFPVIMMWIYPAFFEARPFLVTGRWTADKLRKRRWTRWMAPQLLDGALSEEPEVVETGEAALRRDPTGPWFLDPHKLLVGATELLKKPKPTSLVSTVERGRERGGRLPDVLVLGLCAIAVVLVTLRGLEAKTEERAGGATTAQFVPDASKLPLSDKRAEAEARRKRIDRLGDYGHWWVYAALGFAALAHFRRRPLCDRLERTPNSSAQSKELADKAESAADKPEPAADKPEPAVDKPEPLARPQLIGGTLMRTIVLGFMLYHCGAIATLFIPRYSVTKAWRTETHKVFGGWVRGVNQTQSWKMFAPNPPRSNTFMRTIVVVDDKPYQVGNDHYSGRPYVFWYNDRERKMQRRMVGKSKWYLKYWSAYQCRNWAIDNDGQMPDEVRAIKLRTSIPSPEDLVESGKPSDPRKRKMRKELIETHECKPKMVSPQLKQRLGWELSQEELEKIEFDAKRVAKSAEVTRVNWAQRKDFGGTGPKDADKDANKAKAKAKAKGSAK